MHLCLLSLVALSLSASACTAPARTVAPQERKGVTHIVQPGQTLFRISQAYGVTVAQLMEANRLTASAPLRVGQHLCIPGGTAVAEVEASRRLPATERAALERSLRDMPTVSAPPRAPSAPLAKPPLAAKSDATLIWPILGPINSPFGPRNGRFHAGIDIGSPHYQEVVAAADAEVVYASDTRGPLGKAVVLQHGRDLRTVYAHLAVIIARERETVRQGQAIGGVGATGRATGPHLHFEVWRSGVAVNPEDYLPATIDDLLRKLSEPAGTVSETAGPNQ